MEYLIEKIKGRLQSRRAKAVAALIFLGIGAAIFFAYKQFFPELDLQELLNDFADFFGAWTYLIIGVVAFLETGAFVGLVIPGDTIMILGGAAAGLGDINIFVLLGIAWVMGFLGDSFSFMLGNRLGRDFILKHGHIVALNRERLEKVEDYFDRHGGKTIVIGRFIGLVRAVAPFVAASSGMRYRVFVPYSILGSGAQMSSHILLGYFFAKSIEAAKEYAEYAALAIIALLALGFLIYFGIRFFRSAENRKNLVQRLESNTLGSYIVHAGRLLKPGFDFIRMRLTPGTSFGLEVTTLTAVSAVSLFIMVSYIGLLGGDKELITHGDKIAMDISAFVQSNLVDALAEAFTFLGRKVVLLPLVLIASVYFGVQRQWYILITLLASCFIISSGSEIVNYIIDRPHTQSFPNKDAAFSVLYAWIAITAVLKNPRGLPVGKTATIAIGIIIPALIGLSNVYLDRNYLSDTNAGWAFGVFVFAFVSLVMLVLHQLKTEVKPDNKDNE